LSEKAGVMNFPTTFLVKIVSVIGDGVLAALLATTSIYFIFTF
jgi:hypothetical protein